MQNNTTYSVYLVEDDNLYSELLSVKINDTINADVVRFRTGEEMLKYINNNLVSPDIILLDYYLENDSDINMSGLDVFRNLPEKYNNIPTVLISGSTDYSLVGASLKMGIYDFIHKNENTFDRVENVLKKITETITLKNKLSGINSKTIRVQKIAGFAVLAIIAIISLFGYKF